MKIFLSLLFFAVSGAIFHSTAGEVIIKGNIEGFESKTLKLGVYTNYITNEKKWINAQQITNGKFSFTHTINEVNHFILKVEDKETTLFASPGEVYNIQLSYDSKINEGQSFNKLLNLRFPFPKADGINEQIKKFNRSYQEFMAGNYQAIMIKKAYTAIQQFVEEQTKIYGAQPNTFVKNYVKYALANLQDVSGISKKKLESKYLVGQPILEKNKEYFNFFTQLYSSDFESLALKKVSQPLLKELMLNENATNAVREIQQLKNFQNENLAELYLLYGLYETYHKKTINQKSALKIINQISENSSAKNIQAIASAIASHLNAISNTVVVPPFTLLNTEGKEISLNDFKGKMVYLNFWSVKSIPSLRELKVIEKLHDKYGDKVHFVSINVDEASDNKEIREKYNFQWTFLHYGNDYELREKYKVKTLPSYFLINEKGNMIRAFAENPIEADRTFFDLFK